ncbi:hypothetical protein CHLNCDRAFT_145115 [Chlorella variabilis]|uniref:Uncharacterized protein n=1 Tax=Chlorella variabilis TaxID=554065 RepID=E1ZCL8_CHLVA|nr:hypothetical protein CHLNCDRAFT_145115 [Chlorella variabilis]EFN56458.1 hypothetical protein CHLNCDRAFT_145115 [Chlorella variabilis]|eukprot:XP_005848560.1 hypothetical protein CHLNCDRAFT_145115 [Chlorella variabilis]
MLPAGEPVSSKLQGEGEPRAVPEAQPGEAPTPEHKQAIADLHEPPADLPKGGPSSMGANVGPPGTRVLIAGYAGTTADSIAGSGRGTGARPLGGSKTGSAS